MICFQINATGRMAGIKEKLLGLGRDGKQEALSILVQNQVGINQMSGRTRQCCIGYPAGNDSDIW